jgi:hypothetical protein
MSEATDKLDRAIEYWERSKTNPSTAAITLSGETLKELAAELSELRTRAEANIHDLAREYLATDGIKIRDTQKEGVFLFADWLLERRSK